MNRKGWIGLGILVLGHLSGVFSVYAVDAGFAGNETAESFCSLVAVALMVGAAPLVAAIAGRTP